MQENFIIDAKSRTVAGKGASRRLRIAGLVPGIIYGGEKDPEKVTVVQNELAHHLGHEAFYSHILTVKVDGAEERVVLKDLQRHPAKPFVLHFDLQRVGDNDRIKMHVPLHFTGEKTAPGVKDQGGKFTHCMSDIEIVCAAKDLPEFIAVDVSSMVVGDILHLTDIKLPEGVHVASLMQAVDHDFPVVTIQAPRGGADDDEDAAEEEVTT